MEILGDSRHVGSLDIFEINPMLDLGNKTADMVSEPVTLPLGQQILKQ